MAATRFEEYRSRHFVFDTSYVGARQWIVPEIDPTRVPHVLCHPESGNTRI